MPIVSPIVLRRCARLFLALGLLLPFAAAPSQAQERTLTVFAAASLKNALDDANKAYLAKSAADKHPLKIAASYAASSALARQIEQGAPADVYASADLEWMDYVARKNAVDPATRINLLGNRLVLIAPKDAPVANVAIAEGFDLAKLAGDGRIATGDVQSVPVGKYAKAALEKLGAWSAAAPKFAMADNVRAALTLVARNEAQLGIVYETDAKVEPGVKIVGVFPAGSHPAIVYPFAATGSANAEAAGYLAFLRSGEAKTIFERYGFTVLAAKPAI